MELKTWLKDIADSMMLRKLTIIGTNDSCSSNYTNPIFKSFLKTQDKGIREQLELGARYLDITLIREGVNCFIKCGHELIDVDKFLISECLSFLHENPSEFIIINIRADYECTKLFMRRYSDVINSHDRYVMSTDSDITVGDIRGKVMFMNLIYSNEYIENMRCRVNYNDKYPASYVGCMKKYADVIAFDLESQEQDKRLYVNYTNTKGYILKYLPQPKKSARKINGMIKACFSEIKMKDVILVVDYLDEELSEIILKNNF